MHAIRINEIEIGCHAIGPPTSFATKFIDKILKKRFSWSIILDLVEQISQIESSQRRYCYVP